MYLWHTSNILRVQNRNNKIYVVLDLQVRCLFRRYAHHVRAQGSMASKKNVLLKTEEQNSFVIPWVFTHKNAIPKSYYSRRRV